MASKYLKELFRMDAKIDIDYERISKNLIIKLKCYPINQVGTIGWKETWKIIYWENELEGWEEMKQYLKNEIKIHLICLKRIERNIINRNLLINTL